MIPEIALGHHTRVVLDVGCGVASFGAYLLTRNVTTMSIAPKDVHENQIQFALERGVPAMVAAFATRRLLYPSQAFDLIHCSRCRINWTRDGMSFCFSLFGISIYSHIFLLFPILMFHPSSLTGYFSCWLIFFLRLTLSCHYSVMKMEYYCLK